jgi:hypothetical protein
LRLGAVSGLVGIGNKQKPRRNAVAATAARAIEPIHSMSVEGIVPRDREDPRPGLREILMQARASSLNYARRVVVAARTQS